MSKRYEKTTGARAIAIHGKMVHMTETPATNHPVAIIKMDIASVKVRSTTSTSYVNRFSVRPSGVVSKYNMGARKTLSSIAEKTFFAHLAPPVT